MRMSKQGLQLEPRRLFNAHKKECRSLVFFDTFVLRGCALNEVRDEVVNAIRVTTRANNQMAGGQFLERARGAAQLTHIVRTERYAEPGESTNDASWCRCETIQKLGNQSGCAILGLKRFN